MDAYDRHERPMPGDDIIIDRYKTVTLPDGSTKEEHFRRNYFGYEDEAEYYRKAWVKTGAFSRVLVRTISEIEEIERRRRRRQRLSIRKRP